MKRWRLIVVPIIVVAVGLWVANYSAQKKDLPVIPTEPEVKEPNGNKAKIEGLEDLLKRDPIQFFSMSLKKYDETIHGYSHIFDKHERVGGKLHPPEKCDVRFREKPFSVYMHWLEGRGLAAKVLYVDGENNNKILGRPFIEFLPLQERDVDSAASKEAGRFTIAQFGFKKSTERTLAKMEAAQKRGKLFLTYEGIVPVEKLDGQKCYKFVRTPYDPPEEDGLTELTVYYDTEHWLQVGAVLKDVKGELLGEYFFTKVRINPKFDPDQFTKKAL